MALQPSHTVNQSMISYYTSVTIYHLQPSCNLVLYQVCVWQAIHELVSLCSITGFEHCRNISLIMRNIHRTASQLMQCHFVPKYPRNVLIYYLHACLSQ